MVCVMEIFGVILSIAVMVAMVILVLLLKEEEKARADLETQCMLMELDIYKKIEEVATEISGQITKINSQVKENSVRNDILAEKYEEFRDDSIKLAKEEEEYVSVPTENRPKPSMRNPLRTYEQSYDKFKTVGSQLYGAIQPKKKPVNRGVDN